MDKTMKDLLAAMALREQVKQAAEQRTSAPSLARRPPTALPGLSPRGAELLRAIVGARSSAATRPPDTAVPTAAGSGLGGPLMGGSPNLIGKAGPVSRADLIAQQTGGDVPPPEPMPTPTPTPTAVPNYESSPVLRKRGVEGRPDLQTRQYAAPFRSSIGQPGTPSYRQNQLDEITSYIEAGNYAYPPPGSMIEMEEWGGYEIDEKVAIAEGIRQQIESAPAVVPENLEAVQEEALAREPTVDVGGTVGEGTQWLGSNVRDVLDDPASWAFENLIVKPKKSWDEANAEVMYYMATHDGEMPTWAEIFYGDAARLPDLGIQRIDEDRQIITAYEPGTINTVEIPYVSISDTEVVTADGQVLQRDATGNIIGYRPPQPFTQPTLEDVKGQMAGQETIGQDKTNQVFGPVWLADNPELQPIVAKIYEDAEAARAANPDADLPTGSEALAAWFKTNQTLLGRVIDEVVNDPLNVLFITKILGSGVRSAADAAYIAEHPNLAKLLNASGIVIQLPNTVLNEGPEALFRGGGWLGRKAAGGWAESAVKEGTRVDVESAADVIRTGDDAEAYAMREKAARADAAQAKRDAAARTGAGAGPTPGGPTQSPLPGTGPIPGDTGYTPREGTRYSANPRRSDEVPNDAPVGSMTNKELWAEKKRLQQEINRYGGTWANDAQIARYEALQAEDDLRQSLNIRGYNGVRVRPGRSTVNPAAARTQARIDEAVAKKAEREAKTERDRLIKEAAAREQAAKAAEMPETIPLEAAPTRMADDAVSPPVTGQADTVPVPEAPAGPVTPPPASGRVITQDLGWMSPGTTSKGTPNLTARLLDEPNATSFFREMEDRIASHVRQVDELQGLRATNERFARPAEALERVRFQNEMREAMQFYFPDNPSLWDTAFPFDARKGTEQWAIERAAFGTMDEASEGFRMLRNFERSGGRVVDQGVVDEIRDIRQARFGDADIVDPPAQAVTPPASASPDPWDADLSGEASPTGRMTFRRGDPDRVDIDELQRIAIEGDVGNLSGTFKEWKTNRGASTRARLLLRDRMGWSGDMDSLRDARRAMFREQLGDDVVDGIEQKYGLGAADTRKTKWFLGDRPTTQKEFNATRDAVLGEEPGAGAVGITVNPAEGARRLQARIIRAKQGLGARIDDFGNKIGGTSFAAPRAEPVPFVPDHVVSKGELEEWIARDPNLTQRKINLITTNRTVWKGKGNLRREVSTNYWDEYVAARDAGYAKVMRPYKGEIPDSATDTIVAGLREAEETAHEKAAAVFGELYKPAEVGKMRKVGREITGTPRKILMFNVVTGWKSAFNDWVTTDWRMILSGQGGAVRMKPKLVAALMRDANLESVLDLPQFDRVRKAGVTLPRDLTLTSGREQVERTVRGGIGGKLNPLWNDFVIMVRGSQDNGSRLALYLNYFESNHLRERAKFMRMVREKAGRYGDESLVDDIRDLGPDFSPDDVRRITRAHGLTDDSLARTWAKQMDDLSVQANNAQKRILFTYRKTKADEALSKIFLFHYYMTRASAQYLKLMMQHPQLIRLEASLWAASEESLEDLPAPDWMKGFIGWSAGNGHGLYTNPAMMVSGLGLWSSIGEDGYSKSKVDAALNSTGLFLNPLIQSALASMALSNTTNPLGTNQIERMILAIADEIRNSDYGREHGWQGITPNYARNLTNSLVDHGNEILRGLNLPFDDTEFADTGMVSLGSVRDTMAANFIEEFGPAETWTGEKEYVWDLWEDANQALITGDANEYADAALDEYSALEMQERLGNAVVPTGLYTQDVDAANYAESVDDAFAATGQRDAGQQAALDMNAIGSANDPRSIELAGDTRRYYENVDAIDAQHKAGWSQIAYEQFGPGMGGEIGGTFYTGEQINAMSQEERFALADQWLADQGVVPDRNYFAATTAAGRRASLQAEQKAFRAENPTLDDFLTYQSYVYDMDETPGGRREFRLGLLAVPGDTEFKRVHDRQRQTYSNKGLSGEALEAELDGWLTSQEAYLAIMGIQGQSNMEPGEALFNAVDVAPWRAREQESAGGAGGNAYTTDEKKPKREQVGLAFLRERGKQAAGIGYDVRDSIYALPGSSGSTARPTRLRGQGIFDEYLRAP